MLNTIRFHCFRKRVKKFGVRGLISRNEAKFLFNSVLNSTGHCVEIGSFHGYSTLFLAYASKLAKYPILTSIDPHLGLTLNGNVETYETFIKNIEKFNLKTYVNVKRMTSEKAAQSWSQNISFLWIDGDHDYDAVKLDYASWEPFLIPGGIIAFHDAGENGLCWPGPRKLVDEIELTNNFEPFQYVEGIAWAVKK